MTLGRASLDIGLVRSKAELALKFFAGLLCLFLLVSPSFEGDTEALIEGARTVAGCLARGKFSACDGGGSFPLFQYLPAFFFNSLGISHGATLALLAHLSVFYFLLALRAGSSVLRVRSKRLSLFFVLLVVTSYELWYARSSFGEMGAAFLTLQLFADALAARAPVRIFVWALLAGITKETAPPFLLLLGAVAVLQSAGGLWNVQALRAALKLRRAPLSALSAGIIAAVALNCVFNWVRFGTPWNLGYLYAPYFVKELADHVSLFFGLWLSPAGGVLFFWPAFIAILVSLAAARPRPLTPLLTCFGALALLTWGLSGWWSPFGWLSWGPRFLVPWLPSALLLCLFSYAETLDRLLGRIFRSRLGTAGFLIALLGVGLPHFFSLFSAQPMHDIIATTASCHPESNPVRDPVEYYRCLHSILWRGEPRLFTRTYSLNFRPWQFLLIASYLAMITLLSLRLRDLVLGDSSLTGAGPNSSGPDLGRK